jgi:aminoglycoside phosphotransferase (APT) family kinase protein
MNGKPLLDATTVGDYLVRRGVLERPPDRVVELAGGVSNVVLLAEAGPTRVVVKQALPRLRVADEWYADPARALTEARALRLLGELTPGAVPDVLDEDADRFALTIAAAPDGWMTWKQRLMAGEVRPEVATWLGTLLQRWHTGTTDRELPAGFDNLTAFHQLRIAPYLDTSAARRPELAPLIARHRADLLARQTCLVLGDFSPKNVLVGAEPSGWVIDHEVAHRGDPAFDTGFLLTHLLLKSVHLPAHAGRLRECVDAFLSAYGAFEAAHLWGVVGCLLLARVVGSSPAEYLTPGEAARVEASATWILRNEPDNVSAVWKAVQA